MAKQYRRDDYLYGSARVRALESGLVGRERLTRLSEAADCAEIMRLLIDGGFTPTYGEDGETLLREQTLLRRLADGYAELSSMTRESRPWDFLRFPYDCNNGKVLIKCFFRGRSPDSMLLDGLGTVSVADAKAAFENKDYSAFPAHMAQAMREAEETLAKTSNPQRVDLLMDRACYADMLAFAREGGSAYAVDLVRTRIDLLNIMTCLRLLRMPSSDTVRLLLAEAHILGGTLDGQLLDEALSRGAELLAERLSYTRYDRLGEAIRANADLGRIERLADDLWLTRARGAQYVAFGAEILIGYAVAIEYEVKNLRILLAGKDAGLSAEKIRERLRESYV